MVRYPKNILTLIALLKKLPGVGSKTAERFAFELLKWKNIDLSSLGNLLIAIKDNLQTCEFCGCLKEENHCLFCEDNQKHCSTLCIIASPKDAYLIDETNSFDGLYHVIENLISPMEGFHIEEKTIKKIENRITDNKVEELIIALDSTLEGDATSLFLKGRLKRSNLKISRLAFGLPIGSSLEYIDGGTLAKAFTGRQNF